MLYIVKPQDIITRNGVFVGTYPIKIAVLGALVGFIPFNFAPARTFIGDTGSNFLGFSLAVISILGVAKTYTAAVIVLPLIALGLPIFDTIFAMVRRAVKRRPLFAPDGGHVNHRLIKAGFTQRQAVLILYTVTSTLCIIAVSLITQDLWKLGLLVGMSTIFISLWIASMVRSRDIKADETINNKFKANNT